MFTDMVGYTAMGQTNESLALSLLEEQAKLVRPILKKHGGREVKTMGDAFLVEFPSTLDGVACACDIQGSIRVYNLSQPESRRIHLRIGLHLGDVVESQGDIYGDAVNIASRVEPLAQEDGVCITRQVYDQVHNKFELPMESLGARQLKNIAEPLEVYRLVMPWERETRTGEGAGQHPLPAAPPTNRIAILPFANMSQDPADVYFSDGMTEELITSLSGMKELTVIARTSVMKYRTTQKSISEIARELNVGTVMEGSVRKAGNRVRISVQLINPLTEGHLWAQNYDRQLDDIFAIQDEIAENIARELKVRLAPPEKVRLEKKPTEDAEAYILYLKGRHSWNERSDEGLLRAVTYFEESIKRDPNFALGYVGLADCYHVMARNGPIPPAEAYEKGEKYARKALELDETLGEAHAALASTLNYYRHDWKGSEAEYRRAIELNPGYAPAHQWYAHLLGSQKRVAEVEREMRLALQLDPLSLIMNHNMGASYYYQGKFDEAIHWFQRANDLDPTVLVASHGPTNLIQAYCLNGMPQRAMEEVERVENLARPVRTVKLWRAYVLASMKRSEEARTLLREVVAENQRLHVNPFQIAQVFFVIGDADEGFEWLEKAYEAGDGGIIWMQVEHELDGVRDDPRYLTLLKKIGLSSVRA